MIEFFKAFSETIQYLIEFIVTFFTNVINMCILIYKGFSYASLAIAYLPLQYQVILFALISYAVIVAILHFGG